MAGGDPLDVLVVGGGVVGAGAALDAVTRGLRVGLVEALDYGSGTSSSSSKLIHGGLRYLKQLHFPLVFEALRERRLLMEELCPHLVRPIPFIYPLQRPIWDRAYAGLGIGVYDLLGAGRGVPSHVKHLTKRQTLASFRGAKNESIRGGILFYEGQLDDARHTMLLARTAAAHGALVANSARLTGFIRDGRRVIGASVMDLESGRELTIRADAVVAAAGVWTGDIQKLLGEPPQFRVQASKGVHVLVPRDRIDSDTGLITETETSLLFVIPCPWSDDFWIIGTTDTAWNLDHSRPSTNRTDIDYLLERANALIETPLTTNDIIGVYAGLRPLLAGESDETSKLSREHTVASPAHGVVIVAGGKYTTYRLMAADAIDAATAFVRRPVAPSRTERVPLIGSDGYQQLPRDAEVLAKRAGVPVQQLERMFQRYGTAIHDLVDMMVVQPDLTRQLTAAAPYLRVEALYAVSHEGALHLDDILARRLHASIDTPSRGIEAAMEVAQLVAPLRSWGRDDIRREVDRYIARVNAERQSQTQLTDVEAGAMRIGAADV